MSVFGYSQKITVKNNTGEAITVLALIEKDSIVNSFDSLILKNRLVRPLKKGSIVTLNVKSKIFNLYAFTNKELRNVNCYFIPYCNADNKNLIISKNNLESKFGKGFFISPFSEEFPRIRIRIVNMSGVKLFSVYCKNHLSDTYGSSSIIDSWIPINKGEARVIFFYPKLKKFENENGEVSYEGFLDFKIVGYTDRGDAKTYLIDNFDCVNNDDIYVK